MLSKPKYGWTELDTGKLENEMYIKFRASYLTDVAMDILCTLNRCYKTGKAESVFFDAEGYEYYLVIDNDKSYIVTENYGDRSDYNSCLTFEINSTLEEISKEVLKDIESELESWVNWNYNDTEEEKKERRKALKKEILLLGSNIG